MWLRTGQPGPSFAAIALAGCSIWVVARDWRWRLHHLVPATAGIVAAIITATAPPLLQRWGPEDPARSGLYLLSFTILGLGMVTAGLFDHRLLASSLGPRSPRPSGGRMAIARAESGGPRAAIAAVVCAASGAVASWAGPQFITVALPLALMAALCVSQMVLALFQIAQGIRGGPSAAIPPVVKLHFGPDSLALLLVIALAVAIESAIGARAIALVAFAIGGASAWVAVRDWPYRAHYLIGVVTSASIVLASQQVDPPRLLAIVVCATSAALMLEGLFDHVVATRYRRSERVSDSGAQNADAI
jgi:hypothetical protein